eukprot:EG_transcript_3193
MAVNYVGGLPIVHYPPGFATTGNLTIALDGDLAVFTDEKFCTAVARLLWSTNCANVEFYVYDHLLLPVVTFRFIRLAAGVPVEQYLLQALVDGTLSQDLRQQGLGSIPLGMALYSRPDQPKLLAVNVSLTPNNATLVTSMAIRIVIATPLPAGQIIAVTIPAEFYLTPGALQVEVTGPNRFNQTYQAAAGQVSLGDTVNTIVVNLTGSAQPWRSGDRLMLRFKQGIRMPDSCANMAKWVWLVRTFNASGALFDFRFVNPWENTCSSPKVTIGIPDDGVLLFSWWIGAQPTSCYARESCRVQFSGLRFSGQVNMTAKIAQTLDGTCGGLAPGTAVATLDKFGYATFTPTSVGAFDLCIMHRTNWELLSTKFVVQRPPQPMDYAGAPALLGYSTCAALLRAVPKYCGCYFGDGAAGSAFADVPSDIDVKALLGIPAQY